MFFTRNQTFYLFLDIFINSSEIQDNTPLTLTALQKSINKM
jgi:hypothetical protein